MKNNKETKLQWTINTILKLRNSDYKKKRKRNTNPKLEMKKQGEKQRKKALWILAQRVASKESKRHKNKLGMHLRKSKPQKNA